MDKITLIQEYIDRCDAIISSNNSNEAKVFQDEIIGVFISEIDKIKERLSNYSGIINSTPNFLQDLKILRQKLINYVSNIKEEHSKREYELELARLKQLNVSARAESNPVQNQSVNVTITLDQTLKLIDNIPEDNLSSVDRESLNELLYSLEGVKATKNKSKFWDKAKGVLKFVADKGADAAIAILPYIMSGL